MSGTVETTSPAVRRVRAYFAPVARGLEQPILFDPASSFALATPPGPWIDLGWVFGFQRKSGSKIEALRTGAPAMVQVQVRTAVEATLEFAFETWGKLQLALACGSQSLNVLAEQGGIAKPATPLLAGSTATVLQVRAEAAVGFAAGQTVAVDLDYAGQTGLVGSGMSGAYLRRVVDDADYVRRITLNVGRLASVSGGALALERALPAGAPDAAMKVSRVRGFCDREGGSFFAEWSALFVAEGQQGERVIWHYPRLQTMQGAVEDRVALGGGYEGLRLGAAFRALPITDELDGERVVCFRTCLLA